ncbi:hypothetical protein [Streptomyces sp. KR80]|uniref:hypothetical protein n=1 Tax=Streptomyces sp. KR80 TaxID=3457426 RepID=UPI003FCF9BAC
MKAKLREVRARLDWTQAELIDALLDAADRIGVDAPSRASLKTLVSMHENGRRAVGHQHRVLYREAYQMTDADLGFASDAAPEAPAPLPVPAQRRKLPVPANPEMLAYLMSVLGQHMQAEPMVGPQFLVPPVQSQMGLIEQLCNDTHGPLRQEVLRVGARYCEFLGWLYQDTGNDHLAMRWTGQAQDFAQELDDPALVAYVLQRRSNIATESGQAGHGAGLANAALRHAGDLSPRVQAVVLRQLANSKAGLGEQVETARAVDEAMAAADAGSDTDPLAPYCTVAYVEMEGATCDVRLERPERAVETYRASLEHWPAVQQRDRGLCLARLATANAILEDIEGSYEAAAEAVTIAESTGSARIRNELLRLQPRLAPWRKLVEISELNVVLDRMKRADT